MANSSRIAAERSVNELLAARERYEDEMIRLYQRVESEEHKMREQVEAAHVRERDAEKRVAELETRIFELERNAQDLEETASNVRADSYRLSAASTKSNAKLQAQIKIYEEKLKLANDLQEMYKDSAQTLQDELAKAHALAADQQQQQPGGDHQTVQATSSQAAADGPWVQIYNQELQQANIEKTKLEVKLYHMQTRIQQLQVTELVNETLRTDKERLKAELDNSHAIRDENVKLSAKVLTLERQARQWAAFTQASEYTTPRQLAKQVAELETHIESLHRLLDTSQQIIRIQKSSAGEAQVLKARVGMLETQLSESRQRETKLEIQLATSQTRVKLLEDHLADKPIDLSPLDALSERVDAIPVQSSNKRQLRDEPSENTDSLDKLATKLMEAERRAETSQEQLTMAQKEIEALTAQMADSAPQPAAAVMELKGSPYDNKLKSALELSQSLERENEGLKKQLAGENIRTVPLESLALLNTRLEATKAEADAKYQGLDQLMKGFRSKVTDTKSAERTIFGYELELKNSVTCLVRSQYALDGIDTSLEKSLNFFEIIYDPATKKFCDISCNSLARQYDDLYQYWIRERKYVPGFFASVLLQNYDKFTEKPEHSSLINPQ